MLVLSRKKLEVITIGNDIRVSVQSITGNRVRIGVEAPKEMKVLREELADQEPREEEPVA